MSSTRRVKKGPGRRPQSAKRQRFMELRDRGWSIRAAAREVAFPGRRETTGRAATRPTAVRSSGSCRRWSGWRFARSVARFLSQDERIEIADLRHAGLSIRQIASDWDGRRRRSRGSCAATRHAAAAIGRSRPTGRRPPAGPATIGGASTRTPSCDGLVAELLAQRWSPQQISRHLRCKFPDEQSMWLCHESIYQAVYQPGSTLLRPSTVAPHHRSPLRTGRDHRARTSSAPNGAGHGSSTRCSPSTSGRSRPRTAPKPAIGNLNAVVKRQQVAGSW